MLATLLACKDKETTKAALPASRPTVNVVLISVDTTRADALGVYGNREVDTHALDQLARNGAIFLRHLSNVPLTLPSHASMLTGLLPTENGIHDNNGYTLSRNTRSLASIFKERGYRTAAFVGSAVLNHRFGINEGFSVYDDQFGVSNETRQPRSERDAAETTRKVVEWLQHSINDPFFLFVHYYDPHAPYHPPGEYADRFKNSYLGEISFVDDQIERVLAALQPVKNRTVIAVTADHGEGLGEHNELEHGLFLYDTTLHVPFIVASPSIQPGRKITSLTSICDIAPTLLDLAGIHTTQSFDGRSLVPLLHGGQLPERPVVSETFYPMQISWSPLFAFTSGEMKYIQAPHPEFYNLVKDPGETDNLLPEQRTSAQPLADRINKYRAASLAGRKQERVSPELDEQLRSLGYLSGGSTSLNPDTLPDPKDKIAVWKLVEQSKYLSMEGKNDKAISLMKEALKIEPKNGALYDAAGRYLYKTDPSAAAEMWQKALDLDPHNSAYHHSLAKCYKALGKTDMALQEEELALKIEPQMPEALIGAAELKLQMRQPEESLRYLDRLLAADPSDVTALYHSGIAWIRMGNPIRAAECFQKTIDIDPDLPSPYYDLAILKGQAGDFQSSENLLLKAISLNPDLVEAYYYLGYIYDQTHRTADAIRAYSEFVSRARDLRLNPRVASARARIAALQGS